MGYKVREIDVMYTVSEFEKFIDYIKDNGIKLTKTGKTIMRKDCQELNKILDIKTEENKNYNMDKYIMINTFYYLSIYSGILQLDPLKDRLVIGKNATLYKELNVYSKYLFLLGTWISLVPLTEIFPYSDIDDKYAIGTLDAYLDDVEQLECDEWDLSEDEYFNLYFGPQLKFFGIIDYKIMDFEFYVTLTLLGEAIISYLDFYSYRDSGIKYEYDIFLGDFIYEVADDEDLSLRDLYEALEEVFPNKAINTNQLMNMFDSDELLEESLNVIYDIKVVSDLDGRKSAVIRSSSKHTFMELHDAIQAAFDLDNDHLYSFFLDNKLWSANSINRPEDDRGISSDRVTLGDANLKDKQKIKYLFDYGDMLIYNITIEIIKDDSPLPLRPIITKINNKSAFN